MGRSEKGRARKERGGDCALAAGREGDKESRQIEERRPRATEVVRSGICRPDGRGGAAGAGAGQENSIQQWMEGRYTLAILSWICTKPVRLSS